MVISLIRQYPGSMLNRHTELPSLNNHIHLEYLEYSENPFVAKNLLRLLSRLHIVLPDSIKTFAVGVDDRTALAELVAGKYRREWAAIDDALSRSELEGLKNFSFHGKHGEGREIFNKWDMPILSELLPKSDGRGILGRHIVSCFSMYETHEHHILIFNVS